MVAAVAPPQSALRIVSFLRRRHHLLRCGSLFHTETPVQLSVRTAVENNDHRQIPHILYSAGAESSPDDNPFSFLTGLPPTLTARVVDDILQSFIPLRPRSLPHPAYAALLSLFLPGPSADLGGYLFVNFPLALAVLQTAIRSGYSPPPGTRRSLGLSWVLLRRRHPRHPASRILSSMRDVGYRPDVRTCNYLISSLCLSSETEEAIGVLRGMGGAGCIPDSESYCTVIEACCAPEVDGDSATLGVPAAVQLLRKMVAGEGMVPRKGTVGILVAALRRVGQARRAAQVVMFLEREGFAVGFEEYESALEGCLKGGEFVLAGKMVVEMTQRGYIPYMRARQRVVEGLAGIGQQELASAVRQSLAKVSS